MSEATAREQLLLELINRARLDPAGEARRYGIDLNKDLAPGTITAAPKQVLAFNPRLNDAADAHSQWMLDTDIFSHTGVNGSSPGARMQTAGYSFSGSWTWGENIAWSGSTGSINGDQTVASHHRNLFLSAGHRENLLNDGFREVGLGSLTGAFKSGGTTYNSLMTTEDFARSGSQVFVTGVTYNDTDHDDFYSIGEGAGGRTVQLSHNGTIVASSNSGTVGGYALGTTVSGDIDVQFSGGGLGATMGARVNLAGNNIKIDLVDDDTILSSATAKLTHASADLTLLGIEAIGGSGNGHDNIITGNCAANRLAGRGGDDVIVGGGGNDRLIGGAGDDVLRGGGGRDILIGCAGVDRLIGGAGADTFRFTSVSDSASGAPRDKIADFSGADRIDLSRIDAVAGGLDDAFVLTAGNGAADFSGHAGELHIEQRNGNTFCQADVDGDGSADFQIIVLGLVPLTAVDFIL